MRVMVMREDNKRGEGWCENLRVWPLKRKWMKGNDEGFWFG